MSAAAPDAPPAGCPIDRDVACDGCRYDLRGLTPPGRCPECGLDLSVSLAADGARAASAASRAAAHTPPTTWESRQVFWGCFLLLAAGVPIVAYAVAPAAWEGFRSGTRRILLSDLCASWVLAWYGTVLLTRGDRVGRGAGALRTDPAARPLAFSCTAYALVPLLVGLGRTGDDRRVLELLAVLLIPIALAGLALPVLLPLRLRTLARRVGNARLANESAWLAALTPAAALPMVVLASAGGGISSLDLLGGLPQYPFGSPMLYRLLLHGSGLRSASAPAMLLASGILLVVAWNVSVVLRLMLAHVPSVRGDDALLGGTVGASGRPTEESG